MELSFNFNQATLNCPSTTRHTFYISMIEVHPGQSSIVYLPMINMISLPFLVLVITKCILYVSNTFLSPATNDV